MEILSEELKETIYQSQESIQPVLVPCDERNISNILIYYSKLLRLKQKLTLTNSRYKTSNTGYPLFRYYLGKVLVIPRLITSPNCR
jgi:hypothetical protein